MGPGRRPRRLFWEISLLIHILVLGWAIFFGPVREVVFHRGKPESEVLMRGDELESVIEQVRSTVADELRGRVALLEEGQDRMTDNFETLNENLQPFEAAQRAVASQRFEEYATLMLEGQESLMTSLTQAASTNDYAAMAKAGQEQVPPLISALDEVRRGVFLLTTNQALVVEQAAAESGLYAFEKALHELSTQYSRARRLEREIDELTKQVGVAERDLKKQRAEAASLEADAAKLERDHAAAVKRYAALKKSAPKTAPERTALQTAQQNAADLERKRDKARLRLKGLTRKIASAQNSTLNFQQIRKSKAEEMAGCYKSVEANKREALRLLEEVSHKQAAVIGGVRTAREDGAS